jgi:putative colanic acid biosynthesis acetyltransferase WcaF
MSRNTIFQRLDTTSAAPYSRKDYARKLAWMLVGQPAIRFSPRFCRKFRVIVLRMFGAEVALSANIRPSAVIWHPWLFALGEHSCLGDGVLIYNLGAVRVGSHTVISQRVHVCNGSHDYRRSDLPLLRPDCVIGNGVWICADAFIGPGVTVGDNSVVAAAAVVTKSVPVGLVVGGNPARPIKARFDPPTTAERLDGPS